MASKFTELAIDCADPGGLARFWCSVLDYEVRDEEDGVVTIGSPLVPEGRNRPGPVPPTLTFARVAEGKTRKNRLHLDVNPTDREQDEERCAACSASGPGTPTWARPAKRAGSCLPTRRGTSSAFLRAAAPDRRPSGQRPGLRDACLPGARAGYARRHR